MPIFDILQSYIIKGVIILIIVQTMLSLQQTLYNQNEKSNVEEAMFSVSSIFSSDIRCVGSDTVTQKPFFTTADANAITFYVADSLNFTPIQISYSLSNSGGYLVLNRSINAGTPSKIASNLTQFSLSYFDSLGNSLTQLPLSLNDRKKIKSISVLAQMVRISGNDTAKAIWQTQFYPQNL